MLAVARVAGIQAAKQTPHLLPLCHPLLVGAVLVNFRLEDTLRRGRGQCRHRRPHRRRDGSADRGGDRRAHDLRHVQVDRPVDDDRRPALWEKTGGRSGTWRRQVRRVRPVRPVAITALTGHIRAIRVISTRTVCGSRRSTRETARLRYGPPLVSHALLAFVENKGGREVLTLLVLVILAVLWAVVLAAAVAAIPHASARATRSATSITASTCSAAPVELDAFADARAAVVRTTPLPRSVPHRGSCSRRGRSARRMRRLRRRACGEAAPRRAARASCIVGVAAPMALADVTGSSLFWACPRGRPVSALVAFLGLWAYSRRCRPSRDEGALPAAAAATARARRCAAPPPRSARVDRAAEIAALGDVGARRVRREAPRARDHDRVSRQAIQACAASIRATHRGEFDVAERSSPTKRATIVAEADAALVRPSRRAHERAARTTPRRSCAEAWLTLAFVRDEPLPDARGARRSTSRRTATAWPRPRASCAASCSTGCGPASSTRAETADGRDGRHLLAARDDRLSRRRHRRAAPHDRRARAPCSSAPAATSPPRWSPPGCRARSSPRATRRRAERLGDQAARFGSLAPPSGV